MNDDKYILVGGVPVPEPDLMKWGEWMRSRQNRRIDETTLDGGVRVSTVFLGLDHAFGGGTPILFETMIFGGANDGWQDRYETIEEARKGHRKAVELALIPTGEL